MSGTVFKRNGDARRRKFLVSWILLVVAIVCLPGPISRADNNSQANETKVQGGADLICGPRCVGFLLEYYGHPEPLESLVREIQSPRFEQGSSLTSIKDALSARGIHTAPIRISENAVLCSDYPAIIHLIDDGKEFAPGHYVVWLPDSTESNCQIWGGLSGLQAGPWRSLRGKMSGFVLLTAPHQIRGTSGFVRSTRLFNRVIESHYFTYALTLLSLCALPISLKLFFTGRQAKTPAKFAEGGEYSS